MTDLNEARALAAKLVAYAKDQGGWLNIDDTCEAASTAILALADRLEEVETKERLTYGQWGLTVKLYEKAKASLVTATEALREAIEFADQDAQALTPAGERMIARWRTALATIKAGTAEHPDSAKLREAVDLLRELHDTHVSAFPAVANLGPIARTRAFLAKVEEGATNDQ